jgi:hypothetical protein
MWSGCFKIMSPKLIICFSFIAHAQTHNDTTQNYMSKKGLKSVHFWLKGGGGFMQMWSREMKIVKENEHGQGR